VQRTSEAAWPTRRDSTSAIWTFGDQCSKIGRRGLPTDISILVAGMIFELREFWITGADAPILQQDRPAKAVGSSSTSSPQSREPALTTSTSEIA
jgi:hypothetical protein